MSNYTPGIWKMRSSGLVPSENHIWSESGGELNHIALVGSKEDALLITAAPDMLAALKMAEQFLAKMAFDASPADNVIGWAQESVSAAIKKAEGKP